MGSVDRLDHLVHSFQPDRQSIIHIHISCYTYLRVARDRVAEDLQAQVVHLGLVVLRHVRPVLFIGGVKLDQTGVYIYVPGRAARADREAKAEGKLIYTYKTNNDS